MQDRMLFASPGEADKQSNGKALQSAEGWELACVRVLCDMPISPGEGSEHHCNSRNAFMGYQKQRSSECFPCKMSAGIKKTQYNKLPESLVHWWRQITQVKIKKEEAERIGKTGCIWEQNCGFMASHSLQSEQDS